MLSCGVFPPAPVLSCAHTHSQLSKMCFLDQEISFYHTLLCPKARLWTTLITLLLSSTQPKNPQSHFALFNPLALHFTTYLLQNLCTPSLNFVGHSCSPTPSSPSIAWNPAPTEDVPAPVVTSPLLLSSHSTIWDCVGMRWFPAQLLWMSCIQSSPIVQPMSLSMSSLMAAGSDSPVLHFTSIPQALVATSKALMP